MKWIRLIFVYCLLFPLLGWSHSLPKLKIAIVQDGDANAIKRARKILCNEITLLLENEVEVVFSKDDEFLGDWSGRSIQDSVNQVFKDTSIDMVIGVGTLSSHEIATYSNITKPAFAPFIMNGELQALPLKNGASGIRNLNYLTFPTNLERDFTVFKEMVGFKSLTVLINECDLECIPKVSEKIAEYAKESEVEITLVPVGIRADQALDRLPEKTEAVYLLTLTGLPDEELKLLVKGLIKRKIPTFSLFGQRYLEDGVMASMSPDSDLSRLIRRVAINVQRAYLKEDPGTFPVKISDSQQLAINMETAKAIDICPDWSFVQQAKLIEAHVDNQEGLELKKIVEHAIKQNPDLAAVKQRLFARNQEADLARARLGPQVGLWGSYTRIDKDRAANSFGVWPEKSLRGAVSASQMIYSNQRIGDFFKEKKKGQAATCDYHLDRQDLILLTAQTYLDLLRAKMIEKIHYNNLEKTRSHLKIAKQRVDVGDAKTTEVYRWETQFAQDLSHVTSSRYQTKIANSALKRILNLPGDKELAVKEMSLNEPVWVKKKQWLETHIVSDKSLERYIEISQKEGLKRSNAIKALCNEISAAKIDLGVAKKAFWTPDIWFEGYIADLTTKSGAGSKVKPLFNGTDWAATVQLTFPLYTSGYKSAKKTQATQKLKSLSCQFMAQVEKEKEQVRACAYAATSSYFAISLAQEASRCARDNLSLVQAAYSKGVVSILDLLDAQNQALVSELEMANAAYDFLKDLMNFQRAVGQFDFLLTEDEIDRELVLLNRFFGKD